MEEKIWIIRIWYGLEIEGPWSSNKIKIWIECEYKWIKNKEWNLAITRIKLQMEVRVTWKLKDKYWIRMRSDKKEITLVEPVI